jgi:hypothetical protein
MNQGVGSSNLSGRAIYTRDILRTVTMVFWRGYFWGSVIFTLDNRIAIALRVNDHAAPKITAVKNLKL